MTSPISSCESLERADIITFALALDAMLAQLMDRVRQFYYAVVLVGHACPECGGTLSMIREQRCTCRSCGHTFDPTVVFQPCGSCGAEPRVRIRRYECSHCGAEIVSRFLFDGLVFDAAYFREKMAEHRERRRRERSEHLPAPIAERSPDLEPPPATLDGLGELNAILDALIRGDTRLPRLSQRDEFDLRAYETHVKTHTGPIAISFEQIPPRSENTPRDRIWRFIAIIFLAHAGTLDVWQERTTIWLKAHETH